MIRIFIIAVILSVLTSAAPKPRAIIAEPIMVAQVEQQPPAELKSVMVDAPIRNTITGLQLALTDLATFTPADQPFIRYLWSGSASTDEYIAATFALNCSVNQSSLEVQPTRVQDGALIRIDLRNYVDDVQQLARLISVWDSLALRDPYFHEQTLASTNVVKSKDGKSQQTITTPAHAVAASYFGQTFPAGMIYRLDWFVVQSLSSIDGGAYLNFRGLSTGKTTLESYLKSRGASLEEANRLNAVERVVCMSRITGKRRNITNWHGQGARPSTARPLISLTGDIFDGNTSGQSDSFANLLDARDDGHELFLTLPNGFIEYTLWDGQKKLVGEAPPNLAADHRIPEPFSPRLHGAISCIRCHGPDDGWKPYYNEARDLIGRRVPIDTSKGQGFNEQFKAQRAILFQYGADQLEIDSVLAEARLHLDKRLFKATRAVGDASRVGIRKASEITASVYDAYEYRYVDFQIVLTELGYTGKGIESLTELIGTNPALEHHRILHLTNKRLNLTTKQEEYGTLTRREFEQIFQILMLRAMERKQPLSIFKPAEHLQYRRFLARDRRAA